METQHPKPKSNRFLLIIGSIGLIGIIALYFYQQHANYSYENACGKHWKAASAALLTETKAEHVGKFIDALQYADATGKMATHDALYQFNNHNSFVANFEVIKLAKERVLERKPEQMLTIPWEAYWYETMRGPLNAVRACYMKANYPMVWRWYGSSLTAVLMIMSAVGVWGCVRDLLRPEPEVALPVGVCRRCEHQAPLTYTGLCVPCLEEAEREERCS